MNAHRVVVALLGLSLLAGCAAEGDPATKAFLKGSSCLQRKDYNAAIAAFTQGIRLNPKLAKLYYNRGVAYHKKGQLDKAIADYTEAIRLNEKQAEAYCNRGVAHGEKGDLEKAIADCTEAIRINSSFAEAYYNRGFAYEKKGVKSLAEDDFSMAKKLGYATE